jgi:hypothetical protein
MKARLKLFNTQGEVVFECNETPAEVEQSSMVTRGGHYFAYRGLYGSEGRGEAPYAKFVQCDAPFSLDGMKNEAE